MKTMKDLMTKLGKEIEELAQKEQFTAGDLETLYKLSCTKKNLKKIEMMEMEEDSEDDGYSQRGRPMDYSYDDDGDSYRRGGRRRRNAMGQFARGGGYSRGDRYSMNDGYSRHGSEERIIEIMDDMVEGLSPEERVTAKRMIDRMRNA